MTGQRQSTLSLQAFGTSLDPNRSQDIIDTLHTLLDSPLTTEFLKTQADIAIANRGTPNDVTTLLETGYERRATLDILFNSTQSVPVNPYLIERVKTSGTLKKKSGIEIKPEVDVDTRQT